jgi:hypothetical protein
VVGLDEETESFDWWTTTQLIHALPTLETDKMLQRFLNYWSGPKVER